MGKSITQKIHTTISYLNYNEVCKLSQIVFDAFKNVDASEVMKFAIHFRMGEISMELDNYNDFSQSIYGQDISVISLIFSNYKHKVYVHINQYTLDNGTIEELVSFRVSCEEVPILVKMVTFIESRLVSEGSLRRIKKKANKQSIRSEVGKVSNHDKESKVSAAPQVIITVGGDLNMSGGEIGYNNEVETHGKVTSTILKEENKVPDKSNFWEGVLQQITANWMWWLLCIVGTALVSYIGLS